MMQRIEFLLFNGFSEQFVQNEKKQGKEEKKREAHFPNSLVGAGKYISIKHTEGYRKRNNGDKSPCYLQQSGTYEQTNG
jgi:hypothetical protein